MTSGDKSLLSVGNSSIDIIGWKGLSFSNVNVHEFTCNLEGFCLPGGWVEVCNIIQLRNWPLVHQSLNLTLESSKGVSGEWKVRVLVPLVDDSIPNAVEVLARVVTWEEETVATSISVFV